MQWISKDLLRNWENSSSLLLKKMRGQVQIQHLCVLFLSFAPLSLTSAASASVSHLWNCKLSESMSSRVTLHHLHYAYSCGEHTSPSIRGDNLNLENAFNCHFLLISHLLYVEFDNDLRVKKPLWKYCINDLVTHIKTGNTRQLLFSTVSSAEIPNEEESHLTSVITFSFILFCFRPCRKTDSIKYMLIFAIQKT